ncbi:MAG: flippase [Opitutales bacterium]
MNSIASLMDQGATQFLQLLINILIARELGAIAVGQYNGIMGFAGVVSGLAGFGLQATLLREISKGVNRVPRYLSHAFLIRTLFSIPITVVCTLALCYLFDIERNQLGLIIFIALFNALISLGLLFNAVYVALRACVHYFLINLGYRLAWLIFTVVLIALGFQLFSVVVAGVCLSCVAMFAFYRVVQCLTQHFKLHFDWRFGKTLILKSMPLSFAAVAEFICIRADSIILLAIIGAEVTGYYSTAVSIYLVLSLLPLTLGRIYQPHFISHLQDNAREAYRKLFLYFLGLIGFACFLTLMLWFLSPLAINIIYGPEYRPSIDMLRYLAFILPVIAGGRCLSYALISLRQNGRYFRNTFISAVINVILNIIFIPKYGVYAAIVTTFLAEGYILIMSLFQVEHLRRNALQE